MARPLSVDPARRETAHARVNLRLTSSQRAELEAEAKKAGITVNEAVRRRLWPSF